MVKKKQGSLQAHETRGSIMHARRIGIIKCAAWQAKRIASRMAAAQMKIAS